MIRAPRLLAGLLPALLLSLAATAAAAAPFPDRVELEYRVERSGFRIGTLERTIQRGALAEETGHEYRVESVARPGGIASLLFSGKTRESSRFRWEADGIQPLAYHYDQRTGKEKEVRLDFDYDEGVIRETLRDREWSLEAGAQDLVSAQFAVMRGIAAGQTEFRFPVVDEKGSEIHRYRMVGFEERETPAGTYRTVRVERIRDSRGKRRTVFWLAPEFGYLPVAVEQRKDGDREGLLELEKEPEADFSAIQG